MYGEPLRQGNNSRGGPMGLYHTIDGDITLTVASDDQWNRLATALDAPELVVNPKFATFIERNRNVVEAREKVQAILDRYTRDEAIKLLEDNKVPCGLVRTVPEIIEDSHFWDRGTLQPMKSSAFADSVPGIASGFPVEFSGGGLPQSKGAPMLGEHNQEIYHEVLGISSQDLEQYEQNGII